MADVCASRGAQDLLSSLVTKVQRGVVQVSLAGPSQGHLELQQPPPLPALAAPAPTTDDLLPLALSRPRRGAA